MKRLLKALLTLGVCALALTSSLTASANYNYNYPGDNRKHEYKSGYSYFISKDNSIDIFSCNIGFDKYVKKLVFPKSIDGHKVRGILRGCTVNHNIGEIVIPEGVEMLDDEAFTTTLNLKKVTIPSTVKKIGKRVFLGCNKLKKISLSKSNRYFTVKNNALYSKNRNRLIYYFGSKKQKSYKSPSTLRTVDPCAFQNSNLTSIFLGNSVKKIGSYCFDNSAIKRIKLPKDITAIPECAFFGCEKLRKIKLPSNVKKIGVNAFRDCKLMSKVSVSSKLEIIRFGAFEGCRSLKRITLPKSLKSAKECFAGCKKLKEIVVRSSSVKIRGFAFCTKTIYRANTYPNIKVKAPKNSTMEKYVSKINRTAPCKVSFRVL